MSTARIRHLDFRVGRKNRPGKDLPLAAVLDLLPCREGASFLDSSLCGPQGRWSILGTHPRAVLEDRHGICFCNGVPIGHDFTAALRNLLSTCNRAGRSDLPLADGVIGYMGYDFGRSRLGIPSRHAPSVDLPCARFVAYDRLYVQDADKGTITLIAQGKTEPAEKALDQMERLAKAGIARQARYSAAGTPSAAPIAFSSDFSQAEYLQAVEKLQDYLAEGDAYVANMTQRFTVSSPADPYLVYLHLRESSPAPFASYLHTGNAQIICSSPERFLRVRNRTVETRPIKGTRARGATPTQDAALKRELAESEKDRSELLMVVDLERNDLNRVCEPGSVVVPKLYAIEKYAAVFQLVATVQGRLAGGHDCLDLLKAAFPGGSITGAPKLRVMEILDELEHSARGLYTGSIGYISSTGDCDFNIVIRTAVAQNGIFEIGAGGGITCESDPAFEYQETLLKARAVLQAIAAAERRTHAYHHCR